jgi:TRAP-type mannitol/chloroaromatic compound transport system permease large subunit
LAPAIFYLRAISPPEITLKHMYIGVIPFIIAQLIVLVLILTVPSLALWVPDALSGPSWK